ncbi:site-specific integrase [Catenulispora sp. NL8]|uniref:Site-specific integrase n=1 Tax=Catenulispora pinistramenti TaxID=2705254 RepID=A0ABS5KH25_9ACTN|nr:site-specific integrase [Catenulispora pinistramenti]MBS2545528.1 site-specific integrase [Catenulispora pinistramenti]
MTEIDSGAWCWQVHRYDLSRPGGELMELVARFAPDLPSWIRVRGVEDGQRFVVGPNGLPDLRINECLGSAKWRNLGERTRVSYTYSVVVWLNFLMARGADWWQATEDDAEEFVFWRMTDPANERRIAANSFSRDLAGLKKFYARMGKIHGVADPFEDIEAPRAARQENVKWLDPAGYRRWRDLGVRGMGLDGCVDGWWRGRNEERDAAFCDGLFGTGLRVSEWASVVLPELPRFEPRRGYYTCLLADACAKGGYGHAYWLPQAPMKAALGYVEGPRAAAVRRAQAAGRYERLDGLREVSVAGLSSVTMTGPRGGTVKRAWNDVGPRTRLRLFRRTETGLEPLALWLNEDGLPRDGRGWQHTFDVANERIAALGLTSFSATAHILRHSCALKWYSIGKLVFTSKLGHLDERERADFREQFGDTWHLVQTMLGHRSVETTKNTYLEPFRTLDVEILLAHADDFPIDQVMAAAFADHPRVRTDPLAAA